MPMGGDPEAQYMLGLIYEKGLGVPKDTSGAISWFRKSAASGFIPACKKISEVPNSFWAPGIYKSRVCHAKTGR
ncbi:MAG: tetratricopeptide repeat protein [Terriglobales bacterium]